jgi:DNA-binding response OmpR family regulator
MIEGDNRILIVERDARVANELARIVEGFGYWPETVGDTEQALEQLHELSYQCLLTSLRPPYVDGIDVVSELRRSGVDLPAVVIGAQVDDDGVRRAHDLDAELVLSGPHRVNWIWLLADILARSGQRHSGRLRKAGSPQALTASGDGTQ